MPENDCYRKRLEGSKKYTTNLEEKQIKSVVEKRLAVKIKVAWYGVKFPDYFYWVGIQLL